MLLSLFVPLTVSFTFVPSQGPFTVFDFSRFNIVGSGTYENLPPMITGLTYDRIKDRAKAEIAHPVIFDVFQDAGYVTRFVHSGWSDCKVVCIISLTQPVWS